MESLVISTMISKDLLEYGSRARARESSKDILRFIVESERDGESERDV